MVTARSAQGLTKGVNYQEGVPELLSSDGGVTRFRQHQRATENMYARARRKNSRSYGALRARLQRTAKVSLRRIEVPGGVPGEQSATFRDWHAVPVQAATRNRVGFSASSSHRCQALRPHLEGHSENLELKAVERLLVGYTTNSKGFRFYRPVIRRIMESRNVLFIGTPS